MKVYFDGCSWTNGAELDHPEQERFSKLICDEFGAEETNLSIKGGSNDRIVRNLLVEHNIEDYDLAVIQMTFPVRTEYYDKGWVKVSRNRPWPKSNDVKVNPISDFWKYWFVHITNEKYFETKEKIHYHTIRNSCKIPLVLVTIDRFTKLPFDLQLEDGSRRFKHERGHPNKHLHRLIADKIINIAKGLL